MDQKTITQVEAAVFRRLRHHLKKRNDVQNIDLMIQAGFCRNCLARWYQQAAAKKGSVLDKDTARTLIYGMDYRQWQERYQVEASAEQKAAFAKLES